MNILKIKVLNNDYSVVFFNNASEGVFKVKCDIFLNTDKCRVLRGSSGIFGKQVNICNQAFIFTIYLGYDLSTCENVMKCLNEREIIVQKWNIFAKYFMNDWNKMYEYMMNNIAFDFIDLDSNLRNGKTEINKQQVSISSNNTIDHTSSIISSNKSILDNLINLALADGDVTEKERAIILRKAESLGEDKDEIEMILEGEILKKSVRTTKEAGNISKCPACGGIVKSFLINCQDCGHEFQNIAINESLLNFITKLENEETKIYQNVKYGIESHRLQQKINIIAQFPIPNNKSTTIEFIIYCLPMLENEEINNKERLAWKIKIEQSLNKSNDFKSV